MAIQAFTTTGGTPIAINPLTVLALEATDDQDHTKIVLGSSYTYVVNEAIGVVLSRLNRGGPNV